MKRGILSIVACLILVSCDSAPIEEDETDVQPKVTAEVWPVLPITPQYPEVIQAALEGYRPNDHIRWISDGYSPTGQYLNYWHQIWGNTGSVQFDDEGVPQVKYDGTYYDHPVTLCRYAFHLHGRITRGEGSLLATFLRVVDRLLAMQDDRGAFLYPFPYKLYGHEFEPGWPSGMAQGMALSVLRRAYDLQPEARYIDAGNLATTFLAIEREDGGVKTSLADLHPSLAGYLWIEEFATIPSNYKLNGFLFTLFGLYDWSSFDQEMSEEAGLYFRAGIKTIEHTLQYFDLLGFTSTDLRYLVVPGTKPVAQPAYHRTHIYQLHSLAEITGSPILKGYERLWRWYVESPTLQ